ncbi:hypothetical protein LCGC14_2424710, partial [marine sediment metagenome]
MAKIKVRMFGSSNCKSCKQLLSLLKKKDFESFPKLRIKPKPREFWLKLGRDPQTFWEWRVLASSDWATGSDWRVVDESTPDTI